MEETKMRKLMTLTAVAATLGFGGFALASENEVRCGTSSDRGAVASSVITKSLEDLGYRIQRMETDHGCYEIRALNDSGYPIEVTYAPSTGELVSAQLR
jgi:ABC-type proline/glycine betaine transport system substrate-binding protein